MKHDGLDFNICSNAYGHDPSKKKNPTEAFAKSPVSVSPR